MPDTDDDTPFRMRPAEPAPPPPVPADLRPRRRRRKEGDVWDRMPDLGLVDAIPLTYEMQVNLGVGLAALLVVAGFLSVKFVPRPAGLLLALAVFPLASVFWLWGSAAYAKNKGYPEFVGLMGFTGFLWLLPDRSRG